MTGVLIFLVKPQGAEKYLQLNYINTQNTQKDNNNIEIVVPKIIVVELLQMFLFATCSASKQIIVMPISIT